jgi:diguanylate cyclase (GGDEF)-like protein
LAVDVEPAFYQTFWLRSLAGVLVLLAFYALYLVRVGQLHARSRMLETLVHERTASLAAANTELAQLARTDTLTRLPNRRAFLEAADAERQRMQRSGCPLTIVLGDIDRFKRINDTHGHDAGDAVLRAVASLLRESIRAQDTVARWGGEEVIFLLPETDAEAARIAVEKWRRAVEAVEVPVNEAVLRVTMTFGISRFHPGEAIEQCINRADAALYAGKNAGRNQVVPA